MNLWEVEWSRAHFKLMAIDGIWGVPRSGLVFKKVSTSEMALDDLLPWSEDMGKGWQYGLDVPPNKKELRSCQKSDFEGIAQRFVAAGINVTDPRGLLKD